MSNVKIFAPVPFGLPTGAALTGAEWVPMDQTVGGVTTTIRSQASAIAALAVSSASILGTANQIAVSVTAGVATISFSPNIVIPTPPSGVTMTLGGSDSIPYLQFSNGTSTLQFQTSTINSYIGTTTHTTFNLFTNNLTRLSLGQDGNCTFQAPVSGVSLSIVGTAGSLFAAQALQVTSPNTASNSNGIRVFAGTNSVDSQMVLTNAANTTNHWIFYGDGGLSSDGASQGHGGLSIANLTFATQFNIAQIRMQTFGAGQAVQAAFQYFSDNNLYIDAPFNGTPSGGQIHFRIGSGGAPSDVLDLTGTNGSFAQFNQNSSAFGPAFGGCAGIGLANANAAAQTVIDFAHAGSISGRIRNDFTGGMTYVSTSTGVHNFFVGGDVGVGVVGLTISPGAAFTAIVTSPNIAGASQGLRVFAGTNATDNTLALTNAAQTVNYWLFQGNGGLISSGQANQGIGTINCAGLFINGVAVSTGGGVTTGTFTATIVGITGATAPCTWTKVGNTVTMFMGVASSTAGTGTTFSINNLPAAIQPTTAKFTTCTPIGQNNGTTLVQLGAFVTGANLQFLSTGSLTGWVSGSVRSVGNATGGACFTWDVT